ncbi:hypothetical protein LEMA_P026500.1 [Plenodomus lingam JN3]|uniref:glucan endo-1,3-beta-D-glucosidase n=1 Tax=Leptosphaeria maculans (strain JN3 / isolate v23.1.3 / race Av1-4-5-6-7-8) TaxID=985895 RepID=E4ZV72_LEPMJ|nr:hypothetical protein LEMA_P026500.1 [Plenodomus lingam JN3]CBX95498.1 hypothetical protein LEMA_P026500.1 [Plenodomus lingam JN3]
MRHSILISAIFLPFTYSKTSSQLCSGTAVLSEDGNWYCSEVEAITYHNISQPGAYNRTTSIDPRTGLCSHARQDYSSTGPHTPLFGEVSMHLRGPMNVSQLAVYQLPSEMHSLDRRSTIPFYNRRRTLKQRDASQHSASTIKQPTQTTKARWFPAFRQRCETTSCSQLTVTSTVTITDCTTPTTMEPTDDITYIGPPLPCLHTSAPLPSNSILSAPKSDCGCNSTPSVTRSDRWQPTLLPALMPAPVAQADEVARRDEFPRAESPPDWSRVAYYNSAAAAQATGLSFLANLGDPEQSGTFDYAFGNSLGYVMPNGGQVASESLPFDGTLDTSEREIVVMSDKGCDQDCPYWRPDATSHYGWSGSSKAFLIEFQMDHYPNQGTDQGLISDAPAYWFLNAAIPRILQYGNDRNNVPCSCWSTGCGEFDAFEVLGNGEERAKSTLHRQGNLEGGDSNYFKRPVGATMKFAVVWHYPHITAMVLDDSFDFGERLSDALVQRLVQYDPNSWVHSLFPIGD